MAEEEGDSEFQPDETEIINPEDIVEVYEIGPEDAGAEDMDDDADGAAEGGAGPDDAEGEEGTVAQDRAIIDRGDNSVGVFSEHTAPVFCVALDPSGTLAVTGGEDDCAYVWRVDNGQKVFECREFKDSVTAVAFNHDGSLLATASLDGLLIIWNCASASILCRFDCGDDLAFINWHPSANYILAGTGSGCVHMWEIAHGNMTFFTPHTAAVTGGRWMPDGRTFVTVSEDGTLAVSSPKEQQVIHKFDSTTHQFLGCPLTCLDAHPDNLRVCVGGQDGTSCVIQIKTGKVIGTFDGHTDTIEMVAFSTNPGPSVVASASLDRTVRVYDLSSSLLLCTCSFDAGVAGVKFHVSLPVMYAWSLDGTARVFDPRSGSEIKMLHGHQNHVLDCAISRYGPCGLGTDSSLDRDGKTVITASEDATARVYLNVF